MTARVSPNMWQVPALSGGGRANIVAFGGDGIGPEVVESALKCVHATGAAVEVNVIDEGSVTDLDALKSTFQAADAILYGAADTSKKFAKDVLLYLRFGMDTFANLRPACSLPGVPSVTGTKGTNLVIVRELTEGMYPTREGELADFNKHWTDYRDGLGRPLPSDGQFALRVITENACRRIGKYAADLAVHRRELGVSRGHVTIVDKANVFCASDGLFQRVCREEIERAGITWDHVYVDEAARRLVAIPETFDVIVTTNLFGDILSDVASEVMGGMPMVPSAGIGADRAYFESCHGSAPDIAGKGIANPAATILSASMMLSYLGFSAEADSIVAGILSAIESGDCTADLGGHADTAGFTDAVCRNIG